MYRLAALFTLFALIAWAQLPLQNTLSIQPVKQPTLKAKPHTSKFPAQKIVPKQESSYLLRSIISNRGQGKLTSMLKDGSTLYLGGKYGLRIVDVSDPQNPQQIYFSILPYFAKLKGVAKLEENKILLWRKGKKVDISYKGIIYPSSGSEVFTILDVSDKTKPRVTVQKMFYLLSEEITCERSAIERYNNKRFSQKQLETYIMSPEALGKKTGRTILNDGDFYRRTLVVKGDDIYLCGIFGVARFQHTYENITGQGGSVTTDAIRLKRFVKFYPLFKDKWDEYRKEYYKKHHCIWFDDFRYSGSYMTVGNRHVITMFAVFDRDLRPVENWKRNCNIFTCADGVAMDEDEYTYLFEIKKINNKYRLVTYKMNRYGTLTHMKSSEPELFKKYESALNDIYSNCYNKNFPPCIKRVGMHLFLPFNVAQKGGNNKIEMLKIEPDKSLKTERIIHIGPYRVLDVEYEEPYLYVLSPDAVRIYELKPKND